jgi:tryptophanyl-tRNA synthetase
MRIDPWSSETLDHARLYEFGISPFKPILERISNPHLYMRRGIIFGHRDYELILDAIRRKAPFAVMSGFMPTGKVHLGTKMVMDEIIWHQNQGAEAFVSMADMEAHVVRGISWEKCRSIGMEEYIPSLIALGFKPEGRIYFQSAHHTLKDLAFELGNEVNFSELSAIYGLSPDAKISHLVSILTQSADILLPQLSEYGGPKPVVVPVGADQDPHMRLVRDIAARMGMFRIVPSDTGVSIRAKSASKGALNDIASQMREFGDVQVYRGHIDVICDDLDLSQIESIVRDVELEYGGYGFFIPSSTFHRFSTGLTGGKMSSSVSDSYIALDEDPKEAADKVRKAITGGRVTLGEQKRLGGEPQKCTIYELMSFHLIEDDDQMREIFDDCKNGKLMCGSCKNLAAELMSNFLKQHQDEKEDAIERLDEYGGD